MKHEDFVRSEDILTNKQRKEENGIMPKSKDWLSMRKAKGQGKERNEVKKKAKRNKKNF